MKVLIVDDEPAICELLGFAFGRRDIPVETAPDAETALELARATPFDAALVDKNLPRMNGLQLIGAIRESDARMAILMMTGYASAETAAEALNLDVDAYLEKPFPNMNTVVDRVVDAIEKRRAMRAAVPPAPAAASAPASASPPAAADPAPPPAGVPAPPATTDAPATAPAEVATAATAVPDVPARVLIVATEELTSALRGALLPIDVVITARKETELMQAISRPADLVIIDSFLLGGEVVPIVERVKRVSKEAEFVVLSDRALDLRTIQKLIDLGVRRLVQTGAWARPIRSALDHVRRRGTSRG